MNILCMILGHDPYVSSRGYTLFKLIEFSYVDGQRYLEVCVCRRCKILYASTLEQIDNVIDIPMASDLDPKIINI